MVRTRPVWGFDHDHGAVVRTQGIDSRAANFQIVAVHVVAGGGIEIGSAA